MEGVESLRLAQCPRCQRLFAISSHCDRGHLVITETQRAEIRRLFYAEHWRIGTIAREMGLHPGTVQAAIETVRFNPRTLMRPSRLDPYLDFLPRPCAVARGNEKGRVERQIRFLRDRFFAARSFRDVEDLNAQFLRWREEWAHARPCPGDPRKPLTLVATNDEVRILDGEQEVARHARSYDRPLGIHRLLFLEFNLGSAKVIATMKQVVFAIAIALLFASCGGAPESPLAPVKLNFVLIFIDDMGYGDIGSFGPTLNRTPNLDRLAAEGMKLTSFYAQPVCTASRASLMTGSYPIRNGLQTGYWHPVLMPGDPQGIHEDETTVAEVLKQQGYATGIIGKWHLGDQPQFLPNNHGFDYYFGLPYSNDMTPFTPHRNRDFPPLPLLRNGEVFHEVPEDQSFLTGDYTREALKFIDDHHEEPFFLYLSHSMVHVPLWAGEDFNGTSNNKILGDCIEEIDLSVGEVRKKLEEHGIEENTLVFFTSDNGPARGSAGPLRGRKGSTYEGGMREPTIVWWPGTVLAGSEYGDVASTMDILPTFASLAGGSAPAERTDGHDISEILRGAVDQPSEYDAFYYYLGYKLSAVRSGKWKLHVDGTLYDLEADIGESRDVAAENADTVVRLEGLIEKGRRELGDGPIWPLDPGIELPPTARPIGKIEHQPKLLIPRHGREGDAAHEPPIRTRKTPRPPPDFVRPENW